MNTTFIYALIDPNTLETRYVGKSDHPKSRLSHHINDAKTKTNCHRLAWINSLWKLNQKPILQILEEVSIDVWGEKENYWISQFDNLTNMIDGGKFCPMSIPEIVEKMKATKKANPQQFSEKTRAKLSKSTQNRWNDGTLVYKKRSKDSYETQSETLVKKWAEKTKNEIQKIGQNITKGKNKSIDQYDIDMNFIKTWESIGSVELFFFKRKKSLLTKAIKANQLFQGFYWKFAQK